jgi:hypothetical protein
MRPAKETRFTKKALKVPRPLYSLCSIEYIQFASQLSKGDRNQLAAIRLGRQRAARHGSSSGEKAKGHYSNMPPDRPGGCSLVRGRQLEGGRASRCGTGAGGGAGEGGGGGALAGICQASLVCRS